MERVVEPGHGFVCSMWEKTSKQKNELFEKVGELGMLRRSPTVPKFAEATFPQLFSSPGQDWTCVAGLMTMWCLLLCIQGESLCLVVENKNKNRLDCVLTSLIISIYVGKNEDAVSRSGSERDGVPSLTGHEDVEDSPQLH